MAPSSQMTSYARPATRQTMLPACISTCMASGNLGNCTSLLDSTCICNSQVYQTSVGIILNLRACWASNCTADEIAVGTEYSYQACLSANVTLTASSLPAATSGIDPSANVSSVTSSIASSIVSSTDSVPLGTPSSWSREPILFRNTLTNIQAIMSAVCGVLLIIAITLGIFSCRARVRRDREGTHGSWSGNGTFGGETKHSQMPFGMSRPGHTVSFNPRSQTDTFMTSNTDFAGAGPGIRNSNRSFGTISPLPMGTDRPRFTNRMTVEESDEWEMKDRGVGSSSGGDVKEDIAETELESPTTAVSGMGSQVELVNRLDRDKDIDTGGAV